VRPRRLVVIVAAVVGAVALLRSRRSGSGGAGDTSTTIDKVPTVSGGLPIPVPHGPGPIGDPETPVVD
jgi:hypothetical protein